MVEFGEQLRRAREEKGMTQQSLAEQLYVTRQSVSRWECGDRYPDLLTTKKISEILGVSLDDLLSGKEMEKVVERNPVIENKAANNIMIALYAMVVISLIIPIVDDLLKLPTKGYILDASFITVAFIYFTATVIEMACFVFGLINAIRGLLSPKRMGAVIVGYLAAMCIAMVRIYPVGLSLSEFAASKVFRDTIIVLAISIIPNIVGAVAVFMYFLMGKTHKVWPILIIAVSSFEIVNTIAGRITILVEYSDKFSTYHTVGLFLNCAIYGLIIYQTITLLIKRKRARESKAVQETS